MQDFHVVRCYSCSKFQVHIVRKDCKFSCKVCFAKQSVKKSYGKGSSKDCRNHVQKLNKILITSEEEAAPFSTLNGNSSLNQQHNHDDNYEFNEDANDQNNECSFSLPPYDDGQNLSSNKYNEYSEHQVSDYRLMKNSDLSHNSELNSNYSHANVKHCIVSVTPDSTNDSVSNDDCSTFASLNTNHSSKNDRQRLDESVNTPSSSNITEIHGYEKSPLLSGCWSGSNLLKESKISNYYSDEGNATRTSVKRKASGSSVSEFRNVKTLKPQDKGVDTLKTPSSKSKMLSKLAFFDDLDI